jgi:hypothetical protein
MIESQVGGGDYSVSRNSVAVFGTLSWRFASVLSLSDRERIERGQAALVLIDVPWH